MLCYKGFTHGRFSFKTFVQSTDNTYFWYKSHHLPVTLFRKENITSLQNSKSIHEHLPLFLTGPTYGINDKVLRKGGTLARSTKIARKTGISAAISSWRTAILQSHFRGRETLMKKKILKDSALFDENGLNDSFMMSPQLICLSQLSYYIQT